MANYLVVWRKMTTYHVHVDLLSFLVQLQTGELVQLVDNEADVALELSATLIATWQKEGKRTPLQRLGGQKVWNQLGAVLPSIHQYPIDVQVESARTTNPSKWCSLR